MARTLTRKSLSVLATLALVLSLFAGLTFNISAAGAPTPGNYWTDAGNYKTTWYGSGGQSAYTLDSAADLAGLAYLVNSGTDDFSGAALTLTEDVDLSAYYWYPIGGVSPLSGGAPSGYYFAGTFNGGRNDISGLFIEFITTSPANNSGYGLFGYVNGGTLYDFTISGGVAGSSVDVGGNDVSAIGAAVGYTNGDVYNVHNEIPVTMTNINSSMLGGIAGTVENNDAEKTVQVRYCSNTAELTGRGRVGGIVGAVYCRNAGGVIVDNCYSRGDLHTIGTNQKSYVGGIVGYCRGYISNSYVTDTTITTNGGHYQGGIVGILQGSGPQAQMSSSYAAVIFGAGCDPNYDKALVSSVDNSNNMPIVDCLYDSTLAGSYINPPGSGDNGWGWWTDSGYAVTSAFQNNTNATVYTTTDDETIGTVGGSVSTTMPVLSVLGSAYQADITNINGGYPVLNWQTGTVPPYGPLGYQGIYLDGVNGNDANNGLTPQTAVRTFAVAKGKLTAALPNILVMGTVTISQNEQWSLGGGRSVVRAPGFRNALVDITGGALDIDTTTLTGNRIAVPDAVAALITINGGTLRLLKNVTLTDNANVGAMAVGGGAVTLNSGGLYIENAFIYGNTASDGGGAVYVANNAKAAFTLNPVAGPTIRDEVYLAGSDAVITVTAPLTSLSEPIHVRAAAPVANLVVAAGSGYTLTAKDAQFAECSNSGWDVDLDTATNKLVLTEEQGIFLDGVNGNDSNPGTLAQPVKTLQTAIALAVSGDYGTIYVVNTVTVDSGTVNDNGASGKTITVKRNAQHRAALFVVGSGGSLTLSYVIVDGNQEHVYSAKEPLMVLTKGGSLTLSGATLQNNYNGGIDGGAVNVQAGGTMTVTGGLIANNRATRGGGVFVDSGGTFTMSGGTIDSNSADNTGGGLFVAGTATISNGIINSNSAQSGGGIRVSGGTLTIKGGTIENNSAVNSGGGIYITNAGSATGTVTMDGGTIGGGPTYLNTAANGGGVCLDAGARFVINSGIISGNTATGNGAGIYAEAVSTLQLKPGAAEFDIEDVIYMRAGQYIEVGATLANITGVITVSMENPAVNQIVAQVTGSYSAFVNADRLKFAYSGGGHTFKLYNNNTQIAIRT